MAIYIISFLGFNPRPRTGGDFGYDLFASEL